MFREYCQQNGLWLTAHPKDANYLTKGGESKVYLNGDRKSVLKLNDCVYYATWLEFFNSLVIHNFLFEVTAYDIKFRILGKPPEFFLSLCPKGVRRFLSELSIGV